jgi:predicted transcriptional regulator
MSIKPEYADKIVSGEKKYEFRRRLAKKHVDRIVIYSTAPVMKVIAEVEVKGTISKVPDKLWEKTKKYSGIDWIFFRNYFADKEYAHAYELGEVYVYDEPKNLKEFGYTNAPQSYRYIE